MDLENAENLVASEPIEGSIPPQSSPIQHANSRLAKILNVDKLAQLFQCPNCDDIVTPPIQTCVAGHIVCYTCRWECDDECPLCNSSYSETQNLFAEQLFSKCTIKCKFSNAGCKMVLKGERMIAHNNFCEFRPFECPYCEEYIQHHKFLKHVRRHKIIALEGPECRIKVAMPRYASVADNDTIWIKAYDYNFFGMFAREKSSCHIWVGCMGSILEATKFQCEIIVYNKERGLELRYFGPVQSLRSSFETTVSRGECLITPMYMIKGYANKDGLNSVIFRIYPYNEQMHILRAGMGGVGVRSYGNHSSSSQVEIPVDDSTLNRPRPADEENSQALEVKTKYSENEIAGPSSSSTNLINSQRDHSENNDCNSVQTRSKKRLSSSNDEGLNAQSKKSKK